MGADGMCSTSESDDPYRECTPGIGLLCIATYPVAMRPVYVCEPGCDSQADCLAGDVCCPGTTYGDTFGKTRACVLRQFCESMNAGADAGAPDAQTGDTGDTGTETTAP